MCIKKEKETEADTDGDTQREIEDREIKQKDGCASQRFVSSEEQN